MHSMTKLWYQIKDVLLDGHELSSHVPEIVDQWYYLDQTWHEKVVEMELLMLSVHRRSEFSSGVHKDVTL